METAGGRYTEAELIMSISELMKMARETARAIAHMRKDAKWLDVSRHFDDMQKKLLKLGLKGERGLIL